MEIIRPSFRHRPSLHSVTHISCPPAYPIALYDLSRFHPNSVYKLSTRFKRTPCLTQTLPVSVPLLKSPSPTLLLNAPTPEIMTLTTIQVILILLTTPQQCFKVRLSPVFGPNLEKLQLQLVALFQISEKLQLGLLSTGFMRFFIC